MGKATLRRPAVSVFWMVCAAFLIGACTSGDDSASVAEEAPDPAQAGAGDPSEQTVDTQGATDDGYGGFVAPEDDLAADEAGPGLERGTSR